jgi:hypothetical protein
MYMNLKFLSFLFYFNVGLAFFNIFVASFLFALGQPFTILLLCIPINLLAAYLNKKRIDNINKSKEKK